MMKVLGKYLLLSITIFAPASSPTYILASTHKHFRFDTAQALSISEEINDLNFIAQP